MSEKDTESLELAKNPEKNEARLREMVEEAAKAAMPDSKVVDSNGKLKYVYHGTSNGGHTWFDTYGYYSKFGLFGEGTYFTENKDIAEQYTHKGRGQNPQIYTVFLNITNPIDMDAKADIDAWNDTPLLKKESFDRFNIPTICVFVFIYFDFFVAHFSNSFSIFFKSKNRTITFFVCFFEFL